MDYMEPAERFWAKVDKNGRNNDEIGKCWEWTGGLWRGYGQFKLNGKNRLSHRYSYALHHPLTMDLLEGHRKIFVCHTCDNPRCVNPSHLWLGSQGDNMKDMTVKGRGNQPKGESQATAKLTETQVREIRNKYANGGITQRQLALEYGVNNPTISKIINRRTWSHLLP